MENWIMTMKKADFTALSEQLHITPVTARLLRNRDLMDAQQMRDYLYAGTEALHDPRLMKDAELAIRILMEKIRGQKRIRIIGDYDIDGVNSVYILLTGLTACHACVDYDIPDRMKDGYGLNASMIEKAYKDGVDTILTCDNGISAMDAITGAKELGMTVIVTDHHQIPYEETENGRVSVLPPADAVVDPHREDCPYPFKELCGAVVAWKLVQILYEEMGIGVHAADELIEHAAIATVGDVMDLSGENRILVKEGLKRLPHTKNPGLRALIRVCGQEGKVLTAYSIGFIIGPCINATGRLDSAKRALALLTSKNIKEAQEIAIDLHALNESRKVLTDKNLERAYELIESSGLKEDRVLVVYLPDCHESLAGIIAGRIRERYYRPVLVLTKGEAYVKGSGRSIEAYSMFDELTACKDLLLKYGGHPMAAGLSLAEKDVDLLRKRLNENCRLTAQDLIPRVDLDMVLPFYYAGEKQIREIDLLAPFGKGNDKPLFALKDVRFRDLKVLGKNRRAIKMQLTDPYGTVMEGIWFGDADTFLKELQGRTSLDIAYVPEINEYRGKQTIQIVIQHYR